MILCSIKTSFIASVFMLLIFIGKNTSNAISSPFNLTVSCHNFAVTAHWRYAVPSPGTRFQVKIHREIEHDDPSTVITTQHHCDISSLITSVENSYYLEVRAINGTEESAAELSKTFSFDDYMPSEVKCMLDFPAVELSVKDGWITVHFVHPLQLYKSSPVMRHMEKTAPVEYNKHKEFEYDVVINKSTFVSKCTMSEGICKKAIPVIEKNETYCVTLNGLLKNTAVRRSERICSHEEHQSSHYRLGILFLLIPLVFAFVIMTGIIMFKKVTAAPSNLNFEELKFFASVLSNQCNIIQPESVPVQKVQSVEPRVSTLEEMPTGQLPTTVRPQDGHFRISQVRMSSSNGSAESFLGDDPDVDSGNGIFGYDRPNVVLNVEMSPGDMVTGYGCSNM